MHFQGAPAPVKDLSIRPSRCRRRALLRQWHYSHISALVSGGDGICEVTVRADRGLLIAKILLDRMQLHLTYFASSARSPGPGV